MIADPTPKPISTPAAMPVPPYMKPIPKPISAPAGIKSAAGFFLSLSFLPCFLFLPLLVDDLSKKSRFLRFLCLKQKKNYYS